MVAALTLFRRVCGSVAALFLFAFFTGSSFASFPTVTYYSYYNTSFAFGYGPSSSTTALACESFRAKAALTYPSKTWTIYSQSSVQCRIQNSLGEISDANIMAFGGSCPANSTLGSSVCTCNSGFVESGSSCVALPSNSNGASAPGPLGQAPMAISAAIALGLLAVGAGVLGAPLIGVTALISGAIASGIVASPLWSSSSVYNSTNADAALFNAGNPVTVRLTPSSTNAAGTLSSTPAVGVNTTNQFVPSGGGTASGASGGWSPGAAAGEYTYTPPPVNAVAQPPIAAITNNGYDYKAITAYTGDAPAGSVSVKRYTDGSMNIVQAYKAPVQTSSGEVTTADVAVSKSFGASGVAVSGSSGASVGPTLGNGTASNGGAGIAFLSKGGGTTTAPAPAPAGDPCGAPGQPVCAVKIDETGTQTTPNIDGLSKIDEAQAALDAAISGAISSDGKDTGWGLIPSWLNHSSACQPVVLWTLPQKMGAQQVTLDICPLLPTIYLLMNWLWVVWTFFIIVGMVLRVTTRTE